MKKGRESDRSELASHRAGVERKLGEPEDFARNLQILTRKKRFTAAQAAREITDWWHELAQNGFARTRQTETDQDNLDAVLAQNISERWYRRVMREGVCRGDKRTFRWIQAMAGFFGISYEDFWRADLTSISVNREGEATEFDDMVRQFRQLVESGEEWLAEAVRAAWRAKQG